MTQRVFICLIVTLLFAESVPAGGPLKVLLLAGDESMLRLGSIDGSPRLRLTIEAPAPIAGLSGAQIILTFDRTDA